MASYNRVILVGNLTRDPELRYIPSGTAVTDIGMAINDYVRGSEDVETDPAKATTLINVDSFNDSSIDIMFYCFTKTTDWASG